MQIEVTTDGNVEGTRALIDRIEAEVGTALTRYREQLTRVEVHLGDENADKPGVDDKRCMIEARPAGRPAVAVTGNGATVEGAVGTALKRLRSVLERQAGRRDDRKGGASIRHDEGA